MNNEIALGFCEALGLTLGQAKEVYLALWTLQSQAWDESERPRNIFL